jgi:hypothetical protein
MITNISFPEEIIQSIRQPPTLILETMNDNPSKNHIQLKITINDQQGDDQQGDDQQGDDQQGDDQQGDDQQGDYDRFCEYIIKNNNDLQEQLQSKITEFKDLKLENATCHNRIEYLMRLLQNLEQLRHFYISLEINRDIKTETIQVSSRKIKKIYYDIFYILIAINCLTLVTRFTLETIDWLFTPMQIIYSLSVPYCIYKIYRKYQTLNILEEATKNRLLIQIEEMNSIKHQIKEVEESSIELDNSNYYKTL